jgi:hypothetical protein
MDDASFKSNPHHAREFMQPGAKTRPENFSSVEAADAAGDESSCKIKHEVK